MSSIASSGMHVKNNLNDILTTINSTSVADNYRSFSKIASDVKKDEAEFDKSVKQKSQQSYSNYIINTYA